MRSSGDPVLRVQSQLTPRDRTLLDWLYDHQVLTTFQIAHALFGSLDMAQRRLVKLHRLALVDRFRPLRAGGGSYPWHYVIDQLGADVVAASRAETPPRRDETATRRRRIAASRTLEHRLGANQFFTDLAGHARTHPHAVLHRWWSERQCARYGAFGKVVLKRVKPDGHGVYTEHDTTVAWWLEHDTGTEPLSTLADKLLAYATYVADGGPAWPVLFWLPSTARQANLHRRLAGRVGAVSVATAARDRLPAGASPADAIWHLPGTVTAPLRLVDLADLGDPAPDLDPVPHDLDDD